MGKKLIMFVDDMNMPRLDTYGTQQPIALLKLFVERKGLYDRGKELTWKNIKDVQVIYSTNSKPVSKEVLSPCGL